MNKNKGTQFHLESRNGLLAFHTQFYSSLFPAYLLPAPCPRKGCINSDLPRAPPCRIALSGQGWKGMMSLLYVGERVVVVTALPY